MAAFSIQRTCEKCILVIDLFNFFEIFETFLGHFSEGLAQAQSLKHALKGRPSHQDYNAARPCA